MGEKGKIKVKSHIYNLGKEENDAESFTKLYHLKHLPNHSKYMTPRTNLIDTNEKPMKMTKLYNF